MDIRECIKKLKEEDEIERLLKAEQYLILYQELKKQKDKKDKIENKK
jgi:hypothetical protein